MPHAEQRFRWTWDFESSPEALWPFVSNTERFNRDCGYPPVVVLPSTSQHRRLRAMVMGIAIEWEEHAFEWEQPWRYAVDRFYSSGPVARMIARCELAPRADGGTTLTYELIMTPANLLGRLALPFSIGKQAKAATERVYRRYDEFARQGLQISQLAKKPRLAPGAADRLAVVQRSLGASAGQPAELVGRLVDFLREADDLPAQRMRPYALADAWHADRRDTLKLFLHATRAGVLDFHWDVLCPHCRGAKASATSLGTLDTAVHCDTCHIDFTANFDQSVELTFTPNAAIRPVTRLDYCVGGPQVTPHVVAQQMMQPGERRAFVLAMKPGRYRVRTPGVAELSAFRVEPGKAAAGTLALAATADPAPELSLAPGASLTLVNSSDAPRMAIVEHVEWSDQSTTAAEVTALQLFRDLFAREILRPGGQVSVGSLTVIFTDLKNSTQLYKEIGDAPAFGRVLTHFEVLKAVIAGEGGAIVKTMGDAVMAVFPQPSAGLRALVRAQRYFAQPEDYPLPDGIGKSHEPFPLALKGGLHHGPCIAINQNDRLDYFGTTVNIAARLCALGTGDDLVMSDVVRQDPGVIELMAEHSLLGSGSEIAQLKGFGNEEFEVWRLTAKAEITRSPFWRVGTAESFAPFPKR
ncbi:MAG: adenylate/guanylate cyclase [Verrucomicrobia bacterium]|nr:adenylate/guanylate cyclase [Verrucomicrobiota bacterium]